MPISLSEWRDKLLPGLVAISKISPDRRWDLEINYSTDSINLIADDGFRREVLNRAEIDDNLASTVFGPRVRDAMKGL